MSIDRQKLISRHNPMLNRIDLKSPFSLGNGEFTFTADITGLQTFPHNYISTPLCTMSQWGWHSYPVNMDESELRLKEFDTYGRKVGYATDSVGQQELYDDLRQNPHRLNLAVIGLLMHRNGKSAELSDIKQPHQTLDIYNGLLKSEFTVFDDRISVQTCVDPEYEAVSAKISTALLSSGEIGLVISFPYGSHKKSASDWTNDDKHQTIVYDSSPKKFILKRILDNDVYYIHIEFSQNVTMDFVGKNSIKFIVSECSGELSFYCGFLRKIQTVSACDFNITSARASKHWKSYWNAGGVLQLANSQEQRAYELERRVILSQYLTAIQCSGSVPPAETGLTCNSWYGKFHLEMHFWHAAHFPLWQRSELLERSLDWYIKILPVAREIALSQGYKGARWPKMCDISGRNSPSWIAVLLIWQQPHPILMAELCYRANPSINLLRKYRALVIESADFMASYAYYDEYFERYVLGPPLIPVQETHEPHTSKNPVFELEYFRWGLETANEWLLRLGEPKSEMYSAVVRKLSSLPVKNGVYIAHENCPDTFGFKPFKSDHPSMLGALGVLPGKTVDPSIMRETIKKVLEQWDFYSMWGWDFPLMAMCCAKLGLPELAVDLLLLDTPKNGFLLNGHNPQADREDLPIYLPGNGALLLAAGMMAAGWEGDNNKSAPGFPQNKGWLVEVENISKYI